MIGEKQQLLYINLFLFMSSPKKTISPAKRPKLNQKAQKISPNKTSNKKLQNSRYFCHYSNAIYMGGIDCFKKTGYGLMLTDNGACAITCYNNDNMVNHNIIFRDRSLTSIIIGIHRNKNICFRTGPHLLNIYLSSKDKIQGIGYFVHYRVKKIYKLKFENGNLLIKQRITDQSLSRKVFDQNVLTDLIDQRHIDTLKMNLKLSQEIKCIAVNQTYMIGFSSKPNSKNIIDHNGLCFKITVKQQANSDFDVILQQRGYIERGVINLFGERHFDNGNYYVGEFKLGKFHGQGILIYPKQMKWTFGKYQNGQLHQVIDSSVNSNLTCQDVLLKIHEVCKPYFKNRIQFCVSESFLYSLIKFIDQKDPFETQSIQYTKQQEKKIQNLKTIQDDYTNKKYDLRTEQVLKEVLANKNKKIQVSNVREFTKQNGNTFKQESFGDVSQSKQKRIGSLQRRSKSKSNSQEKKKFQSREKKQNPQTIFNRTITNKSLEKQIQRKNYHHKPQQSRPSLDYQIGSRLLRTQQIRPDLYQHENAFFFKQMRDNQMSSTMPPQLSMPPTNFPNFPNPFAHANFDLNLPSRQYRNQPIRIQDTPIHSLSPQMLGPLQFEANRLKRMHTDLQQSRQRRGRDKSGSPSHSRIPPFKYLDEDNDKDYFDNLIRQRTMRLSNDRYRNQLF